MNTYPSTMGDQRFHRRITATAEQLVAARAELTTWLHDRLPPLSRIRIDDIVLACYEAMANAVEHGYLGRGDGEVVLDAAYRDGGLTITVADNGRWKAPTGEDPFRGRGLPLMEVLSDHNTVTRTPTGTEVTMTWHDPVTDPA